MIALSATFGCRRRDQAAVLSALVTDVVLSMARDVRTTSRSLEASLRALASDPNPELQRAAQAAFKRTTLAWKEAYAFRAGPFVDSNAFQRAAFWPARATLIEDVLSGSAPIDEPLVEALGVDERGLYALEYLLFDTSNASALALAGNARGARARAYALELAANVRGYADRMQRLLGDGHDYAKSFAQGGKLSVDGLVAQALDTLSVVLGKLARVERARHQDLPLAFAVEGYLSGTSLEILSAIVAGARRLYLGDGRGGLSELVAAASTPIDDHVRAAFREAEQQLQGLGAPIETALAQQPARFHAATAAVTELRHVLEVEMQSALAS